MRRDAPRSSKAGVVRKLDTKSPDLGAQQRTRRLVLRASEPLPLRRRRSDSTPIVDRSQPPDNDAQSKADLAESTETGPVTASAASAIDLLGPNDMAELIEVFTVLDRWARELEDGR